jgi:hypothetical protein
MLASSLLKSGQARRFGDVRVTSAFPLTADVRQRGSASPKSAYEETHAPQQATPLFDHLVGAGKHGRYSASIPTPTASSGQSPPKWVVRDMFDLPMHSWWRRTKTGATFPRALANRLSSPARAVASTARAYTHLNSPKFPRTCGNSEVVADAEVVLIGKAAAQPGHWPSEFDSGTQSNCGVTIGVVE